MFIGRSQDLRILQQAYDAPGLQVVIVYGRRRVGKTSLLHEFAEGKPNVRYFTAQQTSAAENLRLLSDCLLRETAPDDPSGLEAASFAGGAPPSLPSFDSFAAAFDHVFAAARESRERTMLVLDEYPYLAQSYPGASSLLQALIDREMQSARRSRGASQLFLVLCGSSLSFMEHQVLGEKSPLYGRRTAQIRVEPFDAFDARALLGDPSPQKTVELYSLVGGVPLYLEKLNPKKSIATNIADNILRPGAYLYVEPQNYLMQAVSNPAQYNAVITAIAKGNVKLKDIADATGQSAPAVSKLLAPLIEMRIVERVTPLVKATRKQVNYRLGDDLFRFWFSFAPRYATAIEAELGETVARRIAEAQSFSTYVGPVFEQVCRQWFLRAIKAGAVDMLPKAVGTWWGTDPSAKRSEEIDIVVEGSEGELIVGECKWRNEKTDVEVLDTLVRRAQLLGRPVEGHYLFSKTGFTAACQRKAAALPSARLLTVDDMFALI